MAKNQSKRLNAKTLQADVEAFQALQALTTYKPANADFEIEKITDSFDKMSVKQTAEVQTAATAAAARDDATAAEWDFHNLVQGGKTQVKAQFGEDSMEVQAMGLKRKSEYKNPARKVKSSGA